MRWFLAVVTRSNELALHLQMELPAALWSAIVKGIEGHAAATHWEAAMAIRKEIGLDDIPGTDMIWQWPGAGAKNLN